MSEEYRAAGTQSRPLPVSAVVRIRAAGQHSILPDHAESGELHAEALPVTKRTNLLQRLLTPTAVRQRTAARLPACARRRPARSLRSSLPRHSWHRRRRYNLADVRYNISGYSGSAISAHQADSDGGLHQSGDRYRRKSRSHVSHRIGHHPK